jgi:hypothetical protein
MRAVPRYARALPDGAAAACPGHTGVPGASAHGAAHYGTLTKPIPRTAAHGSFARADRLTQVTQVTCTAWPALAIGVAYIEHPARIEPAGTGAVRNAAGRQHTPHTSHAWPYTRKPVTRD